MSKKLFGALSMIPIGLLILAGCAPAESSDEASSQGGDSGIIINEKEGSFEIPLPSDAAAQEFSDIFYKSIDRYLILGGVETLVYDDGSEENVSFILDPTFELGPASITVGVAAADETALAADWTDSFIENSVIQASNYFLDEEPVEFTATKVGDNQFLITDETNGSRAFYINGGLISGIDVSRPDGAYIGRTYLVYGITEIEKGLVKQVADASDPAELEALFSEEESEGAPSDQIPAAPAP